MPEESNMAVIERVRTGRESIGITVNDKVKALMIPSDRVSEDRITHYLSYVIVANGLSQIATRVEQSHDIIGIKREGVVLAIMVDVETYKKILSEEFERSGRRTVRIDLSEYLKDRTSPPLQKKPDPGAKYE